MKSTILSPELLAHLWIPQGGDGADDDSGNNTGEDDADKDTGDAGDEDEDEDGDEGYSKEAFAKLRADFNRVKKHLSNADRRKSAAEKALEEAQRKERSDLENAQADAKRLTDETTAWQARFTGMALTNSFLIESSRAKIQWHDPEVAQAAAKLTDMEVGDDGDVEGMAEAVKALAKNKPFLVNAAGGSAGEENGKTKDDKVVSGSKLGTGTKAKGKPSQLSEEELFARFPALRR